MTAQSAKTRLAERIVLQAEHDGIPLSETESKMLYFSENYWTLPGMAEINADFDSNYDPAKYEKKIAGVVSGFLRTTSADERKALGWDDSIRVLRKEDHYILVLIDSAPAVRPRGYLLKIILVSMAVVFVLLYVAGLMMNR
jgi:hypothetical protein